MTLIEFNKLRAQERVELVWARAMFLCTDRNGWTNYYALDDFYLEVPLVTGTRITKVRAFHKGTLHERMLTLIGLAGCMV